VLGAPWQLDLQARRTLYPAWLRLDPQRRGGLFQALALENELGRPHFERIDSPDPPVAKEVKDHD
jgi:23S rRNA (adenine2030-N6)-methyltransferase